LSTIVDAFYVLKGQSGLDGDGKMVVDLADAEISRLSRIVKQSLSYYRTGAESKDVDLSILVEQSLDVFSGIVRGAGIEVKQKLTFGMLISGYPDEIRQVIDNLLLNAVEATPKGGHISISVRKSRSWKNGTPPGVRLTIADNGCGMPPEQLANIFEPFFTAKSKKGTGFGLWVVNSLVGKHDGVIRIRSSQPVGKSGTVFSILFPSSRDEPRATEQVESQSTA
jgi:signal transduction histidine kinase